MFYINIYTQEGILVAKYKFKHIQLNIPKGLLNKHTQKERRTYTHTQKKRDRETETEKRPRETYFKSIFINN